MLHQRNIQIITIEIFKVKIIISADITNEILKFSKNSTYE